MLFLIVKNWTFKSDLIGPAINYPNLLSDSYFRYILKGILKRL